VVATVDVVAEDFAAAFIADLARIMGAGVACWNCGTRALRTGEFYAVGVWQMQLSFKQGAHASGRIFRRVDGLEEAMQAHYRTQA
jgi:hypothetical protein